MERIEGQGEDQKEMAEQVLSWITCAKRPLTTLELQHALAVEIGASVFDEENLPETEDMVSVCAGLITIDDHSQIIRLNHYTIQEYFERTWKTWFPNAHEGIANICITYLSYDIFEPGHCSTDEEFERRLQHYALYGYSAENWGHHCRSQSVDEQLTLRLLKNASKVEACSQALMTSIYSSDYRGYSQQVPRQLTGVHLAAYFGLENIILSLIKDVNHCDIKDTFGRTPLSWAAENGREGVVKLLLERGVDPDSKASDWEFEDLTPLSWAAENGHEEVVKLLLEHGADPDSKANGDLIGGRTPLSFAAGNGHKFVVKLLLENGVDPERRDTEWGQTPLLWAAENGHYSVVQLLLEHGADPNTAADQWFIEGWTPLLWAAQNGNEAVVKLLIENGAKPDTKDKRGRTALSWAAGNGHEAIVKLLLETGVGLASKDTEFGQTPLSWAAEKGHVCVVRLLLDHGADPGCKNRNDQTPLQLANANNHKDVVNLLRATEL
jgi:ankyrin repeat protein